jgi:hypothetical protein
MKDSGALECFEAEALRSFEQEPDELGRSGKLRCLTV